MNNFGVIEVAGSKTTQAPGWAYIPDTGASTAAAFQPANRKRAARNKATLNPSDVSARQDAKVRKELEALDRDNHKDVSIPIPPKAGGSRAQNKHTPNVRKILQSQKTFANHLDDYQAMLAHAENNPTPGGGNNALASKVSGPPIHNQPAAATRRGGSHKATTSSSKAGRRISTPATASTKAAAASATVADDPQDVEMADADATALGGGGGGGGGESQEPRLAPPTDDDEEEQPKSYPPDGTILPAYTGAAPPKPHAGDADPLLVSRIPPFPTDDELRALLTAAPLSYTEARAVLGDAGEEDEAARYPARRFCGVCGYWGRVRCTKCGARVCALDCLDVHRQECFTRYGM